MQKEIKEFFNIPILHQVGGSLGLWLGLGALQILQHIITIAEPIIKKFNLRVLQIFIHVVIYPL